MPKKCIVLPWWNYKDDVVSRDTARILKAYLIRAYEKLGPPPVNTTRKRKGRIPINGLVTQQSGRLKKAEPFPEKYGLKALLMASDLVYWGFASFIGMSSKKVVDTGKPDIDIEKRIETARTDLAEYDFIHIHTKTPDEAAQTKDPQLKKTVIELLDNGIGQAIGPILDDPDILLIVTSDHSTPSRGPLVHSGESVPLVFYGSGIRRDDIQRFDEISAAKDVLGDVRGKELLYLILNHL